VIAEVGIPLARPRLLADPSVARLEAELLAHLLVTPTRGTPAPPR